MGNTEDVINSQNPIDVNSGINETLNDADKINNYVSWYLNGTLNRAEYPFLSLENISKVVDYSGPINKLLPQDVQFEKRAETVAQAKVTRHDQVVGCSLDISPNIFGIIGSVLNIGQIHLLDIPIPCYTNGFLNSVAGILGAKKEHRLSEWTPNNLPPVISDPKYINNYSQYLIDYKSWRGYLCPHITIPRSILGIPIPVIGGQTIVLCVNNVFQSKFNSYLYNYIPYSSTEDVVGTINVNGAYPAPNNTAIITEAVFSSLPSKLSFPHMVETNQLGAILQDTYIPKGLSKTGSPTNVALQKSCKNVEVRSNKGDNLFATQIKGKLSYKAEFYCVYKINRCKPNCPPLKCCPFPTQVCNTDVYFNLTTNTKIPLVDEIWSRLVAGPMAVFKRIFPKTNTIGSVGQIMDIAGATNITYTVEPTHINNVSLAGSTTNTDLKFPHIGGISEYFLKGIQTALRPKGYGEPIAFANSSSSIVPSGTCDGAVFKNYNPPSQTTTKANDYFTMYVLPNISSELFAVYKEAERQTGVPCEVLAGIHFEEGGNNPNQDLQSGAPLNGRSLIDSAVQAGHAIAAKVGGTINNWNDLITAVSYYNGGGNRNCGRGVGYHGPCPPPTGIDDPYATSWIDSGHNPMYLIYCWDYTQCVPTLPSFPYYSRPGVLTVATELYNSK